MPPNKRNPPDNGTEAERSDASPIADLYRSSSDHPGKQAGGVANHSTIPVWAGILLLTGMLAFGFHQIRGWQRGFQERLEQVARDNKLLLEGLDELLARANQPDRVAGTESPPPVQAAKQTTIEEESPSKSLSKKYKIYYLTKNGEDLKQISQKFAVSEDQLRNWNALEPKDALLPGQVLVINRRTGPGKPAGTLPAPAPPDLHAMTAKSETSAEGETDSMEALSDRQPEKEPVPTGTAAESTAPKVRSEQSSITESSVAQATAPESSAAQPTAPGGTGFDAALAAPESSDSIASGSQVTTTEGPQEPVPSTQEVSHKVQVGENLYRIGGMYGVSWEQIAKANGVTEPTRLYVGQVLKIQAPKRRPAK